MAETKINLDWEFSDNIFNAEGTRDIFESINGANLNSKEQCFKLGSRDESGNVREGIFTVPENFYLENLLDRMPYGIINKKATGIGATTLEIKSDRNSIIVMPAKSLAYAKAKKHPDNTLYIGSEIGNIRTPVTIDDIKRFDEDSSIPNKKFLVVADSLPRLIDILIDHVYDEYFIMIDEVDVLQSDSDFRPALETVLDFYFRFPQKKRCVVSATIRNFSHTQLKNDTIITIIKQTGSHRNIDLYEIEKGNLNNKLIELIKSISNEKILIAYNSVASIVKTIEGLPDELKNDCGVLCSPASKENTLGYFRELSNSILSDRITFMTSSYFVGIDIDEQYHLITVANGNLPEPITLNKHTQIYGRCRHVNGVLSDKIIYELSNPSLDLTRTKVEYESYLVNRAELGSKICSEIDAYRTSEHYDINDIAFEDLIYNVKYKITEAFVENGIKLLRETTDRKIQIAYFNIDNLTEKYELELDKVYTETRVFSDILQSIGHSVNYEKIEIPNNNRQNSIEIQTNARLLYKKLEMAERAKIRINEVYEIASFRDRNLGLLIKGTKDRTERLFIERFKQLHKYVPKEQLFEILNKLVENENTNRVYNRIHNQIIFWALNPDNLFKKTIFNLFNENVFFTKEEIIELLREPFSLHLNITINSQIVINYLSMLINIGDDSRYNENRKRIRGYKVKSYLPEEIEILSGIQPIEYINISSRLHSIFKF